MSDSLVYLVDDDAAVLRGLSRLLRAAGWTVRAFDSAQAFLDGLPADAAGCVVLDVSMPGLDGPAVQRELLRRASRLSIVFLTAHGDLATGVRAMKDGAADFLSKPVDDETLIETVRAAVQRSRAARDLSNEQADIRRRLELLTPRELEVLELLVTGMLNKQIAARLGTVEKTIKVHRARVLAKMEAGSLVELARMAARAGIGGTTA